jgi:hypothetical protein
MVTWRDVLDQDERRAEALRQADHWRLEQAAQGTAYRGPNRLAAVLIRWGSRLGAWMERTGCHLQTRLKALEQRAVLNTPTQGATMNGCP